MGNPHVSLANVLAPASSPTHPVSLARYATESWSKGGVLLGLAILAIVIFAALAIGRKAARSASK